MVEESGMLKTIDEFDPDLNKIGINELDKFFSEYDPTYRNRSRPKGLDYLVMDNFKENLALEMSDLMNAKDEAE